MRKILLLPVVLFFLIPANALAGEARILVCPSSGSSWPKTTPSGATNAANLPQTKSGDISISGVGLASLQFSLIDKTWSGESFLKNWVQGTGNDRYPGVRLGSGPRTLVSDGSDGVSDPGSGDMQNYIKGMMKGQYLGAHRTYSRISNSCASSGSSGAGALITALANRNEPGQSGYNANLPSFNGFAQTPSGYNVNNETGLVNRVAMIISAPIDNALPVGTASNESNYGFTSIETKQRIFIPLWNSESRGWQAKSALYNPGLRLAGDDAESSKIITGCFGYRRINSTTDTSGTPWCTDSDVLKKVPGVSVSPGEDGSPGWNYSNFGTLNSFNSSPKRLWYDSSFTNTTVANSQTSPAISTNSPRQEFVSEIFCSVSNIDLCYTGNPSQVSDPGRSGIRDFIATAKDTTSPSLNLGDKNIISVKNSQGKIEGIAPDVSTNSGLLSNKLSWIKNINTPGAAYRFKAMDKGLGVESYSVFLKNFNSSVNVPVTPLDPLVSSSNSYLVNLNSGPSPQCTDWGYLGTRSVQYRLDRSFEVPGTGSNSVPADASQNSTNSYTSPGYVAPHYTINHPPICPSSVDVEIPISNTSWFLKEGYNEAIVTVNDFSANDRKSGQNTSIIKEPILIDSVSPVGNNIYPASIPDSNSIRCYPLPQQSDDCSSISGSNQPKWIAGSEMEIKGSARDPLGTQASPTEGYSNSGMATGPLNKTKIGYKIISDSGQSAWADSCQSSGDGSKVHTLNTGAGTPDVGPLSNSYQCDRPFAYANRKTFNLPQTGTRMVFAADFKDFAGNTNEYKSGEFIVDNEAPTNTSFAKDENKVMLSADDNVGGSGVKSISYREYKPSGTQDPWTPVSTPSIGSEISTSNPVEIKTEDNVSNQSSSIIINPKKPQLSLDCDQSEEWTKGNVVCTATATRVPYSPKVEKIIPTVKSAAGSFQIDTEINPEVSSQMNNEESVVKTTFTIPGEGVAILEVEAVGDTGMSTKETLTVKKDSANPVINTFTVSANQSLDYSGTFTGESFKGFVKLSATESDPFVDSNFSIGATDPWFLTDENNTKSRIRARSAYNDLLPNIKNTFKPEASGINSTSGAFIVCAVELNSDNQCSQRPNESMIGLGSYLPSDDRWFVLNQSGAVLAPGTCAGTLTGGDCIFDASKLPFRSGDEYYIRYRAVDAAGNISYSTGQKIKTTGACQLPALPGE